MLEMIGMVIAAALVWLALELGAFVLFYWPGWLALRVVTLGRYPPRRPVQHNRVLVSAIGAAAIVLFGLTLATVMSA
jgi:hypothetical protein